MPIVRTLCPWSCRYTGDVDVVAPAFAGTATTLVPPTTDRAQVANAIDHLDLAESTAIGEAIFTSLQAIKNFQSTVESGDSRPPPARIVLLSDGTNTVGRPDTQAVDAAKAAGVPVSTTRP